MNCSTGRRPVYLATCFQKYGGKKCGLPAHTWKISKHGIDLGTADLCQRHCDQHRQGGYNLVATEKAKGAAA